jgi:hypothetical protein
MASKNVDVKRAKGLVSVHIIKGKTYAKNAKEVVYASTINNEDNVNNAIRNNILLELFVIELAET